jgi:hypothetical protein
MPEKTRIATPERDVCLADENAWYVGCDMAMAFCRLTEQLASEPGTKIEKEIRCLEEALKRDFLDFCPQKEINLIDLGTGDGRKTNLIIKALNREGGKSVRYVPVDANRYISCYAILSILGGGKKFWTKEEAGKVFDPMCRIDFDDSPYTDSISIEDLVRLSKLYPTRDQFSIRNEVTIPTAGLEIDFIRNLPEVVSNAKELNRGGTNLFCMLGNTFGNYLTEERTRFLNTLYDEMEFGDLFLFGISLRPDEIGGSSEEIRILEREHLPGEAFMRLGADHPQSRYVIKYDPISCCMKYSFVRPDKSIQDIGYSYLFDAGDVVRDLEAARIEVVSCKSYPFNPDSGNRTQFEREPKYLTVLGRKTRR